MDKTGLRSGLNWIREKGSQFTNWFSNTAVGKFVDYAMPFIEIGGAFLGGGVGWVLNGISKANRTVRAFTDNPLSFIPGNISDRFFNSGLVRSFNSAKEYVSEYVPRTFNRLKDSFMSSSFGRYASAGF